MGGDLSLSQSLGALRIANPDDSPLNSLEGTGSSHLTSMFPSTSISPLEVLPADTTFKSSSGSTPTVNDLSSSYGSSPSQMTLRILDPVSQHQKNRTSVFTSQEAQPIPQHLHAPLGGMARPVSGFYTQPFANNSSSTTPTTRENPYRIRTDSSASSVSETITRANSRGGSSALQAGVPSRDSSHTERSYKQSPFPAGNGPLPPRQSSRPLGHNGGGAIPPAGSPYALENGPLLSSEDWQERGATVAVRQEIDANGKTVSRYIKKGVRDFSFGHVLGEGSYSTVVLATDRQTLNEYAIKILDKRHIIKEKKVKYVNIEKDTLNRLTDHLGIVRLYYTFQDERSLYFVLDYCKGGELLGVLKRMSTFDEECTRFYGAQILDTIDYMHRRGVIHRDLKPENILLDSQMHTKITDFGTAKILKTQKRPEDGSNGVLPIDSLDISQDDRANSFVGTAEYVSPELLTDKNACKASDLWAFGCIVFQLLAGRPPFKASNDFLTFQKIVGLDYEFPTGFPSVARDLVERLLVLDPARRLPIEHIKNHEFFDGIAWGRSLWKQKAPRLKPYAPPPREPIKLNGLNDGDSYPPNISTTPSTLADVNSRAFPRVITELPPPSQLDIEWSPVLSKTSERILKLGNLVVSSSPVPHSLISRNGESETPKKFSRFFGGSTTKKRQRLVMVTSSARIILAAAGGEEKKAKLELSLLSPGTQYRRTTDSRGFSSWVVDTRDKRLAFEDPKPASSSITTSTMSTQEWLDALDKAKEMALSQQGSVYSSDEAFRDLSSGISSHTNTLDCSSELHGEGSPAPRTTLVKQQTADSDSLKGKKRFSRRHSKNGLAAVF
ncbi:hypothetical protein Egran_06576 [Elaphomyces granulatus]|uniref:non-specific serine/threonine protein kinase n=1 Tax=Elaphomyces granulatus TaxID=519963 RepID=A0A232LNE1_9EURO|nr:hypothetical protein Egran_06576 [Elaphomyces granulatus]